MATQLTNYQCPACTGPLHFDGASGKLVCDFCGSSYDTAEIEALYAEKEAAAETAAQNKQAPPPDSVWSENEAAGLRSYSCPSCGAELICDETTAATSSRIAAIQRSSRGSSAACSGLSLSCRLCWIRTPPRPH